MKIIKKILALMCVAMLCLTFTSCGEDEPEYYDNLLSGKYEATITVKDMGDIELLLDADTAPITVTNFKELADEGFYDGLTFHRVIEGFMIQGGDPKGDGTGGSSQEIVGEFSANGVKNDISHTRGVISMARSDDMDSASSQFFIVHQDSTFLDGQYAAFGYVTSGMEIVDKIATETPVTDDNGTVKAGYKPVIKTITVKKSKDDVSVSTETLSTASDYTPNEGDVLHHAVIKVKDMGEIRVALNETVAPITVQNFIKLANEGFYDGLTFHRVIEGFMIQGGDPKADGTGGSDTEIKGEFSENGVENNIPHVRGVISMARNSVSMDSASSQFFIVHENATYLDGQYAAFGYVTEGMDIVDKIATETPVTDDNGTVLKENQPVIESIKILD